MNMKTVFAGMMILILTVSFSFGQSNKAIHIKEGQCVLFDGDGNLVVTDDVKIVVTNSAKGNVILKCKTQGVENNQGTAVHWDAYENPLNWYQKSDDPSPVLCSAPIGGSITHLTEDWQMVVSEKGNAMVTCRFRTN